MTTYLRRSLLPMTSRSTNRAAVPSEAQEQASLFAWASMVESMYPGIERMHHIPNGGSRRPREAAALKRQGVKAGVPDVSLPAARHTYHGLYIEMKRRAGGETSPEQADWHQALMDEGYLVCVCRGWEEARDVIIAYLKRGA